MQSRIDKPLVAMMEHEGKDVKRIQHFLKVHELARLIGQTEVLVNLFESDHPAETQREVYRRIFKTEGGKRLFRAMFARE